MKVCTYLGAADVYRDEQLHDNKTVLSPEQIAEIDAYAAGVMIDPLKELDDYREQLHERLCCITSFMRGRPH